MEQFEKQAEQVEKPFEVTEVRIGLPTHGYISGRYWGNKSVRPFICVHGWLDNAGTFDRLIPLLPKEHSYLSIDFPGHGKSSWHPKGVPYHNIDYVYMLAMIMDEYKWDKISILAHSLGAYVGFMFASIYPEKVDILISVDAIKPNIYSSSIYTTSIRESIENFPIAEKQIEQGDEKDYTYEEAIEKVCKGTFNSVDRKSAPYLLRRGLVKSKKHPGKLCFAADPRQKFNFGFNLGHPLYLDLARNIKVPFLVLKAIKFPMIEEKKYFDEVLQTLKDNNANFEYHEIDTFSHHLHLTQPESIADLISNFIRKYKKLQSKL